MTSYRDPWEDIAGDSSIALLPLTGPQINLLWEKGHRKFCDLSGVELQKYWGFKNRTARTIDARLRDLDRDWGIPDLNKKPRPSTISVERRAYVARMSEIGMTTKNIAAILDCSTARVWQMKQDIKQAKRLADRFKALEPAPWLRAPQ